MITKENLKKFFFAFVGLFAIFFVAYVITFYVQIIDLKTKTNDSDLLSSVNTQSTILLTVNSIFIVLLFLAFALICWFYSDNNYFEIFGLAFMVLMFGFLLFSLIYSSVIWSKIKSEDTNSDIINNLHNVEALIALPAVLLIFFVIIILLYKFYDFRLQKRNDSNSPIIDALQDTNRIISHQSQSDSDTELPEFFSDDNQNRRMFDQKLRNDDYDIIEDDYDYGQESEEENESFISKLISHITKLFHNKKTYTETVPMANVGT